MRRITPAVYGASVRGTTGTSGYRPPLRRSAIAPDPCSARELGAGVLEVEAALDAPHPPVVDVALVGRHDDGLALRLQHLVHEPLVGGRPLLDDAALAAVV